MAKLMELPLMGRKKSEDSEGRNRPVRCVLTDEERLLVRKAAASKDMSMSGFAVWAVVQAAKRILGADEDAEDGSQAPRPKSKK